MVLIDFFLEFFPNKDLTFLIVSKIEMITWLAFNKPAHTFKVQAFLLRIKVTSVSLGLEKGIYFEAKWEWIDLEHFLVVTAFANGDWMWLSILDSRIVENDVFQFRSRSGRRPTWPTSSTRSRRTPASTPTETMSCPWTSGQLSNNTFSQSCFRGWSRRFAFVGQTGKNSFICLEAN